MIAAILRAQWLSMRPAGRRSVLLSAIVWVIWYGFWCVASYGLHTAAADAGPARLAWGVPLGLLLVTCYWQFVPVLSGSLGASVDMRKLLVYPVPHSRLFIVEVLLRFTTAAEMLLVLAGGLSGLMRNQVFSGWAGPLRIAAAGVLYVSFNVLIGSGLRSLLERLFSRRYVREVLVFTMLLLFTAPRVLIQTGLIPHSTLWLDGIARTPALPWAAASLLVLGQAAWVSWAVLAGWIGVAAWFGRTQFERNLRYDYTAAQATPRSGQPASSWSERLYRLPSLFLRDPLAAMVEKEFRSLARAPRFRMVFLMGFSFGLLVWLPMVLGKGTSRSGAFGENFLVVVCVYALTLLGQVTYWNCFGFDRSAVQIYFVTPQPIALALIAKNITALVAVYLETLVLTAVTFALRLEASPRKVVECFLVVGICSLYMLAFGNISSVRFPRALRPERVSQGGASSRFQALIFIFYPLALLPVFLAYLARYAFASQIAFVVVLAFAAVLGGVLYWIGTDSAINSAARFRERIVADLSQGEGPLATE